VALSEGGRDLRGSVQRVRVRALAAGLLVFATAACRDAKEPQSAAQRPNVVLVTIDTWRADRLGVGISPALDELAASGIRFTGARTAAPLTLPSHATILTGLLPPAHGVRVNGLDRLSDAHPTVARLLKDAGYRTAAFVGAFVLDRQFGLASGFDLYDDRIPRDPRAPERLDAERPASAVVDRALAWLDSLPDHPAPPAPPAPFFLWIHVYDPHAPYNPPPEFLERVERLDAAHTRSRSTEQMAYDGEVAYADSQLARVLARLRTPGFAGPTVIIIAGDHGEGLGEHGERTHGMLLYDSTLRVPLVIVAPGERAEVREEAVGLADIAPTILGAAGVTRPEAMKGRNLLLRLRPPDGRVRLQPDLYAETEYPRAAGWSPLQALTDGRWIAIRAGASTEVYDLSSDPQELHDVAAINPSIGNAMRVRIDAIRAAGSTDNQSGSPGLSPEAEERLRALGYVATGPRSAVSAGAPNPAAQINAWNQFEEALNALQLQRAEALPMLERLVHEHPESPVFEATAARALKEAGKLNQALAAYRSAVRRWPTDAALRHDLAVAAREAAQAASGSTAHALHEEAANADRAALALMPDSALAHNGLGLLAVDEGHVQDAAAEFDRAAALDPNNASYLSNLGNARRALGDRAGAEQAYRQAIAISNRSADAANGLGVLLVEAHRPAEAVEWFERALASTPDFAEARLNLGIALQESGQPARAVDEYRKVLGAAGAEHEKQAAAKLLATLGAGRTQ